ncbi:MAG: peptidoglycan DD-metalloendopeptidase family protein [Cyclobacteriaceae bacterium]
MKRLFILSLTAITVLTGIYYINYTEDHARSVATLDKATVAVLEPIDMPDHIGWIDSIRRENPSLLTKNNAIRKTTYNIASGDTFNKILSKLGLENSIVSKLSYLASQKFNVSSFKIGQEITVYQKGSKPFKLEYPLSVTAVLQIDVEKLSVEILEKEVVTKVNDFKSNVITSLASTLAKKNRPTDLADKLLSIFAWDIDFMRLQKEDVFGIVYEEQSVDNEIIGSGKILSAYIIHEGRKFEAYYYQNDSLKGYFSPEGINYSHAPLEFDLITSLYKKRRYHPVKRRYRAHLGMDFMAEEGTPIEALKDGKIIAAGYRRANGNYVKIRHEDIITQYLHLSEIDTAITVGKEVAQGTVIGKVGSTGLSSGPHLCLRVWKNGRQKDPLKFDFKRRASVPADDMAAFMQMVKVQKAQLP